MKTIAGTVKFKIFLLAFLILIIGIGIYSYRYIQIYSSITVSASKSNKIEYGTANYNVEDLYDKVSGTVVSVSKDININKVGKQEVVLKVEKDNVVRAVPLVVEVVDTGCPVINLANDVITVNRYTSYDIHSNILGVSDDYDGNLKYKKNTDIKENDTGYYTVNGVVDTNVIGCTNIEVKAIDNAGNITVKNFTVNVIDSSREQRIRSIAYSLLGSSYVSGGNSPSGFDCSGFVQYVYSRLGISISRSASTQLYDGYEVSVGNIREGDIIVWGYDREHITHTGIYVGNGLMIHAANPSEGVIVNNIDTWGQWTGVQIVSVRRLK